MLIESLPTLWKTMLSFKTKEKKNYPTACCLCYSNSINDFLQTKLFLHPKENDYLKQLQFENRIKSYLAGRYAAKNAISLLSGEEKLCTIAIEQGVFHQPIVRDLDNSEIQVTISHCDNLGIALAYSDACPLGVDIEKIQDNKQSVLAKQMTDEEHKLMKSLPFSLAHSLTFFWSVKESLSKALKTGFTSPIDIFAIQEVEVEYPKITYYFKYFPQYCATSFLFATYVCSITYPKVANWPKDIIYNLLNQLIPILEG